MQLLQSNKILDEIIYKMFHLNCIFFILCLFQLYVSSSRLVIFFSKSQQELPSVALPAPEKIKD